MIIKHHKIITPDWIEAELSQQFEYIAIEQKDPVLAQEWLEGIEKAIASLAEFPGRCSIAPENSDNSKTTIRHLIYKKSFRIIFTIVKNEVKILNVRHSSQLPLNYLQN
jgi:plasmid stabilization system protein ParE